MTGFHLILRPGDAIYLRSEGRWSEQLVLGGSGSGSGMGGCMDQETRCSSGSSFVGWALDTCTSSRLL